MKNWVLFHSRHVYCGLNQSVIVPSTPAALVCFQSHLNLSNPILCSSYGITNVHGEHKHCSRYIFTYYYFGVIMTSPKRSSATHGTSVLWKPMRLLLTKCKPEYKLHSHLHSQDSTVPVQPNLDHLLYLLV